MASKILILLTLIFFISCNKNEILNTDEFIVIIENEKNIACELLVIRFINNKMNVQEKTALETLTYLAYKLDTTLNKEGAKLIIKFTKTVHEDLKPCNTLGIGYPSITILEARTYN